MTNLAADTETLEVTLEVEGDAETVAGVLPEEAGTPLRIGETRWRVTVPGLSQEGVDSLVDAVRGQGLSLVSISRERLTLEEAFLRLVRAAGDKS